VTAGTASGFMPNDDVEAYRATLRSFLSRRAPEANVRQWMQNDHGYDEDLWRRAASELGLQGLLIREDLGGSGASLVELGVAFEELGRGLTCGPFLSTLGLAVPLLSSVDRRPDADRGAAADLLAAIAAGSAVVAVVTDAALAETDGCLSGTAGTVLDGADASAVIVPVRRLDGTLDLRLVHTGAPGLTVEPLVSLDSTRRLARLGFDAVPGDLLLAGADSALAQAEAVASLLLSAEQLGGAATVLSSTIAADRKSVV